MAKSKAMYYPNEIVIDGRNYKKFIDPSIDGEIKKCGTEPRDWKRFPHGSLKHAKPFDLPLIPKDEWQDRLDEQIKNAAQLSQMRSVAMPDGKPIPSRDQNGKGYCWAHSTTSAMILARMVNNQPYADLSAYAIACIIKNFRDEGGWNSESVEFACNRGIPSSATWPQRSMEKANDNPKTWEDAKLHVVTEWMDLDPNQMKEQLITCLLLGMPLASDFNWWSHSVCSTDLVAIEPFQTRIWNSWGDSWSANGMGVLKGSKAIPDNAIALRVIRASAA